jgi:hypothetical protein
MSLQVRFLRPGAPAGNWRAERCSWAAVGGPDEAELVLNNPSGTDLAHLAGLLGCPLELWDSLRGLPAWWGYVTTLEMRRGALCQSLSLDDLANRVAVSYLQTAPGQSGGRPALTDWAEEPVSIGLYGVHERILALAEASQERAEALRDAVLAAQAHPRPQVEWSGESKSADLQIRLVARGWWSVLDQRYLALPAAREECKALGPGVQALGAGSSSQKLAQSVTPASTGWVAREVWLQVRKQGSPADALKVELAADSGGAPGTVLGGGELAAADVPIDFRWVRVGLAAPLTVSGPLWLVVNRTGGLSVTNYYRLRVDETCSYSGGALWVWNGSSWANRSPAADLTFRLAGEMETGQQMLRLTAAGIPPLGGAQLWGASGVFSDPYTSGLHPVRAELEELLAGGAGGVRWLAGVTPQRQVVFGPQPAADAPRLRLGMDGRLRLMDGRLASPADPLAGQWAAAEGGAPVFLERVEWRNGIFNTESTG